MTGLVVANRQPIWLARHDEIPAGDSAAEDHATLRAVIGVPLSWRGSIVGACVVFSRDPSRLLPVTMQKWATSRPSGGPFLHDHVEARGSPADVGPW